MISFIHDGIAKRGKHEVHGLGSDEEMLDEGYYRIIPRMIRSKVMDTIWYTSVERGWIGFNLSGWGSGREGK